MTDHDNSDNNDYEDATVVRRHRAEQADGTELTLTLLQGVNSAEGHACIHRVMAGRDGRPTSDIVYFYSPAVAFDLVSIDFDLLVGHKLMSVNQLHHTEFMLNRRLRSVR